MILYIEKDVANNINSEIIISHNDFKIWKLVKGNFKTLCICICFYFVMLIYSSFIIIKKKLIEFFLMTTLKRISGTATVHQALKEVFVIYFLRGLYQTFKVD